MRVHACVFVCVCVFIFMYIFIFIYTMAMEMNVLNSITLHALLPPEQVLIICIFG